MNLVELQHALRQLRCSGMAAGLEARVLQAQAEHLPPFDCLSRLVQDELVRRQDRLLERRLKHAGFRDVGKRLDTFDFDFNKKMPRALVFELATARWVTQHADALFLGAPGTGKSHLAQAIGFAVIQQGHRVLYRETHALLDELAEAQLAGIRKAYVTDLTTVPLLIIDDLGMRKLPHTAAEDLLEIVMRQPTSVPSSEISLLPRAPGEFEPSITIVCRLAKVLCVPENELVGLSEEPRPRSGYSGQV
ncbi:MAG TPA: ATP-binding protein, partial [Methylomirabilota bacterium]|nr:ATP-binding protein [Methylomirabilota bacterium]